MHRAGAATFAFTFMAILPGLLAFYLTYIRRIGRLDDGLPNAFAGMKNVLVRVCCFVHLRTLLQQPPSPAHFHVWMDAVCQAASGCVLFTPLHHLHAR